MLKWIAVLLLALPAFGQSKLGGYSATSSGSGSQRVVYTSQIIGTTTDVAVAPGSSAAGNTGRAAAINAAIAGGNVKLVHDVNVGLEASLVLYSNTQVECLPGKGSIMNIGSESPMFVNAHPNGATTASGTGGYLVSNITDSDITVTGCKINPNSTEAVTGTDTAFGVAHKTSAITGKDVYTFQLLGVQRLNILNNEIYDSATYCIGASNITQANISGNWCHNPLPLVVQKNTDGIHFVGPATFLNIANNKLNGSDDQIALNADDINRTGSGDAGLTLTNYAGWKWGPITDVTISDNSFDYSTTGIRLFSGTELIDRIRIYRTTGTVQNVAMIIYPYTVFGTGNFGSVTVDGFEVTTDGSSLLIGKSLMRVGGNIKALTLNNLRYANPVVSWPLFSEDAAGTIGILKVSGLSLDTTSGIMANPFSFTGGTVSNMSFSGVSWLDSTNDAATLISGSAAPTALGISGYVGPGRAIPPSINSPGVVTPTPSTTGGTLAAATYYYKVTALTALGESTPSAEVSATTTGTTSSVALSWATVPGATSYRIYRGTTAGGESVYYSTSSSAATISYTDTNAASTAGTVPTVNGTSGFPVASKYGDAFSNSYPANTTYVSTAFLEGAASATITGTSPASHSATTAPTWQALGATSTAVFASGGGVSLTGQTTETYNVIDTGQSNETVVFHNVSSAAANGRQLIVRGTDYAHAVLVNLSPAAFDVYDQQNASTFVHVGATTNYTTNTGDVTVVLNGLQVTVTAFNSQPTTFTLPSSINLSGTLVGFGNFTNGQAMTIASIKASSY